MELTSHLWLMKLERIRRDKVKSQVIWKADLLAPYRSSWEVELKKNAVFSTKDQVPKIPIQQKKDVDQYFRKMSDITEWWIKVDVLKGRDTDMPKFRVDRKKAGGRWDNKWHIDIKDPSIWGRLPDTQKKEHLKKETMATTIGGDLK